MYPCASSAAGYTRFFLFLIIVDLSLPIQLTLRPQCRNLDLTRKNPGSLFMERFHTGALFPPFPVFEKNVLPLRSMSVLLHAFCNKADVVLKFKCLTVR